MKAAAPYRPKSFDLSGLQGISDQTLEMHIKLYEGYVDATNQLTERIAEMLEGGPVGAKSMQAYSELKRRMGFELNGMVLHEQYFSNLRKGGGGEPGPNSAFLSGVGSSFGSLEAWRVDFVSVGRMRGVGWTVCCEDPETGRLSNHWITLHEVGNVATFTPVLVMDVWEHAFLLDYKPADRPKYIEAFLANVDWAAVDARMAGGTGRTAQRP